MSDLEHKLRQFATEHDCDNCDAEVKDGCTLRDLMPFLRLTLAWGEDSEGRKGELSEIQKDSEGIVRGAIMLLTTGETSIEVLMSIFGLLITFGYVRGREYVEVPKPYTEANIDTGA